MSKESQQCIDTLSAIISALEARNAELSKTDYDRPYECACCGKDSTAYLCIACAEENSKMYSRIAVLTTANARLTQERDAAVAKWELNNTKFQQTEATYCFYKEENKRLRDEISDLNWNLRKEIDKATLYREALAELIEAHKGVITYPDMLFCRPGEEANRKYIRWQKAKAKAKEIV